MRPFFDESTWLFLKEYNYLVYWEVSTNDSIHITVKKSRGQILEHFEINFYKAFFLTDYDALSRRLK